MVQYSDAQLDASFAALADVTRRGILERLCRGPAPVSLLAGQFGMSVTGLRKHLVVLEDAGLVRTRKLGRVRECSLGERALEAEAAWIARHQALWAARFAALDDVLADMKREERRDG